MITVLVFNNSTGRMETYQRNLSDAMPYNVNRTLSVREFRANSRSNIIWTSTNTMTAWNNFRARWGSPIHVGACFRRIGENRHADQSQHYAGTAFDVGQNLNNTQRSSMRNLAISSRIWAHVDPASATPTWVHFDMRQGPPACAAGFPTLRRGAVSNYVCTLQDALQTNNWLGAQLDGNFGPITEEAVRAFQRSVNLTADGVVGCNTWRALTSRANGRLC